MPLLVALVLAALPLHAERTTTPSVERAGNVQLVGLDGKVESRPTAGFETNDPRSLGAHVVLFEGAVAPAALDADTMQLGLAGGERWVGRLKSATEEEVEVAIDAKLTLRATIDELVSLAFPMRVPPGWTGTLEPAKEGDRLFRIRGDALDVVDGALEEFSAQGVRFHGARVDSRLFPWSEIAALYVEGLGVKGDASTPADAAKGVPIVADLVQESRVRGTLRSFANGKLAMTVRRGQELELPFALVRQAFVDDGRARYLSLVKPSKAEDARPFGDDLGMRWPHQVDRSVTGRPLTAGGRTWSYGFGVHAPSKLAFALEPGWTSLRGKVAIDDEVLALASRGAVQFRVLVDGKKAWESAVLHGGETPVDLPAIDLANAKELVLEVGASGDSFVADRADWLGVMLIR